MIRSTKSHKSKADKAETKKNNTIRMGFLLVFIIVFYLIFKDLQSSLFLKSKDRVNLFFYDKISPFISLGLYDKVNYQVNFYPDLKVLVPGGYGYYRIGGLGKLVYLEKKPDIFRKSISLATSSFIDYYFYLPKDEVYYGNDQNNLNNLNTKLTKVFFSRSNAGFFDRLFIFLRLIGKRSNDFIRVNPKSEIIDNHDIFFDKEFFKAYQGFFYQRSYRSERQTVQLIYTKDYKTASLIGRIIDGEGIRIVDLAKHEKTPGTSKQCQIIEEKEKFSETAKALKNFFNCQLLKKKTEMSDIIFELGSLERDWEIN